MNLAFLSGSAGGYLAGEQAATEHNRMSWLERRELQSRRDSNPHSPLQKYLLPTPPARVVVLARFLSNT
jgi:hypothetical protein